MIPSPLEAFEGRRSGDQLSIRLRVVWGGEPGLSYQLEVESLDGKLHPIRQLGIDPLDTGSVPVDENGMIQIVDRSTRFGGLDLEITGKPTSRVVFRCRNFKTERDKEARWNSENGHQYTLRELADGPKQIELGQQSIFHIDRLPGDSLRVTNGKDNWVYEPQESLPLNIEAYCTKWSNQSLLVRAYLIHVRSSRELASRSLVLQTDDHGSAPAVLIENLQAPSEEGAYELRIEVEPKRLFGPIGLDRLSLKRRVQFVVVSDRHVVVSNTSRPAGSFDWASRELDSNSESLDSNSKTAGFRPIKSLAANLGKWSQGRSGLIDESDPLSVGPKQTCRVPIQLDNVSPARRIRFQVCRGGLNCELNLYEVESGTSSRRLLFAQSLSPSTSELLREITDSGERGWWRELWFYAKSSQLLLEIVNRSTRETVELQSLGIFDMGYDSGKRLRHASSGITEQITPEDWRALLAVGRRVTNSTYDSWESLQAAIEPWLIACRRRGVQMISIPVVAQASTLYPSRRIHSLPWLDTGCYDQNGIDPVPKDVVRWLYRLCNKHELQFLPSLRWDFGPGAFTSSTRMHPSMLQFDDESPEDRGSRLYALHPQWTQEIQSLLIEFETRYRQERGYIGVSLHIDSKSHFHIPEDLHRLSGEIIQAFAGSLNGQTPGNLEEKRAALIRVAGSSFDVWQRQTIYDAIDHWKRDIVRITYENNLAEQDIHVQEGLDVCSLLGESQSNLDVAGLRWTYGLRPLVIQSDIQDPLLPADSHRKSFSSIPPQSHESVPRLLSAQAADRLRVWRSIPSNENLSQAIVLNAGPFAAEVELSWTIQPGTVTLEEESEEVRWEPNRIAPERGTLSIPAQSLVIVQWGNRNADLIGWSSNDSVFKDRTRKALAQVEKIVNRLSMPSFESSAMANSSFENSGVHSEKISNWAVSLNPRVHFSVDRQHAYEGSSALKIQWEGTSDSAWLQSPLFDLSRNRAQISIKAMIATGSVEQVSMTLLAQQSDGQTCLPVARREIDLKNSATDSLWQTWIADFTPEMMSQVVDQRTSYYRLQLDITGKGVLWLDDVRVAQSFLTAKERQEVRNALFVARNSLEEGSSDAALQFIGSKWLRSLDWSVLKSDSIPSEQPTKKAEQETESPWLPWKNSPLKSSDRKRWGFWNR